MPTTRAYSTTCPRTHRSAPRGEVVRSAASPGSVRVSVPGGGSPRGELSSAHGGHGSRRKATSCPSGATECAWVATVVGGRQPAAHRELPSAHGGHEIEARAAHYRGALAHNPSHHAPQSPLIRARTRYVEFGPSHPHVGLLFRAWATPPACGIGGSRAGQAARVQTQVESCSITQLPGHVGGYKHAGPMCIGPAFPREEDRKIRRGRPWRGRRGSR